MAARLSLMTSPSWLRTIVSMSSTIAALRRASLVTVAAYCGTLFLGPVLHAAAQELATPPSAADTSATAAPDSGAAALLDGVEAIPPVGTVGQVAVWGDGAFPVVLGKEGDKRVPIVGAGTLGRGRVMAWAHGYGSASAAARLSTGRLLLNACRWTSERAGSGPRPVRVALLDSDLSEYLKSEGIEAAKINGGDGLAEQLDGATTLLCGRADLSKREIEAIAAFVRAGGGFVCFFCPWGWAQIHRQPVAAIPLNEILVEAGLALADGYAEPTKDGAFAADFVPGPEFHAGRALDILTEVNEGKRKPDDPLIRQAGATATRAVAALPSSDRLLRPRLNSLLSAHNHDLAPTPDNPLQESEALQRVLLALQLSKIESQQPAEVKPHVAARAFPGEVPATARKASRQVIIDTAVPNWHSTGLYAPAGQVITVTLPPGEKEAAQAGLRVRIGCHADELWHHDQWRRVPRISMSWPIDSERVTVASAFGGLIYIEVPEKAKLDTLNLTVSGGVESPWFVLGETSNADWAARIRDLPAPWAELASDRVILTIPSDVARKIDDPQAIMEHWVRILDADAELAGLSRERPYPQRYVADTQISAGYMHAGYPIMTHLDAASFMTDPKGLVEKGWGPYHEMGHNHQQGMWTFEGTGEVTCNIFTLYVLENVCGVDDASRQKVFGEDAVKARANYLESGARFETWKREPFLALQMYAQLRLAFGWDAYRKVFAEYGSLPADQRPRTDEEKRDQWLVRMSRAVSKDLGPFFEAWGVPTSAAARDSIKDLPDWMPDEMLRD